MTEIMKKMGEVFLLRSNIASVGSVLDSPDVFWVSCGFSICLTDYQTHHWLQTYPDLQPLYDAARSYLELPQRINLLNTRVGVICFPVETCSHFLIYLFWIVGFARYAAASERVRLKSPFGTPRTDCHRPHRHRDWCAPLVPFLHFFTHGICLRLVLGIVTILVDLFA